jgi:hypothetical protein
MLTSAEIGKQNGDTRTHKPEPGYLNLSIVFIFPDVQRNMTSKNGRFEIEPGAANLELSGSSYDQWSFLTDD